MCTAYVRQVHGVHRSNAAAVVPGRYTPFKGYPWLRCDCRARMCTYGSFPRGVRRALPPWVSVSRPLGACSGVTGEGTLRRRSMTQRVNPGGQFRTAQVAVTCGLLVAQLRHWPYTNCVIC